VIATDLRGVRVPVRLTGCGRVVPSGDPRALAAAINEGLRGEWRLTAAEIAARAWKTFSNQESVDKIRHLYEEVDRSKSDQ
jgi:glycosyltransferase involved in cell wall biosynthesis